MIRVPTPLIDAVRELSRLYRDGYTHTVLTGLQQLIASIDSSTDSVDINTDSKSDTELIIELIARVSLLEKTVAPIPEKMAAIEMDLGELSA